MTVNPDPNEILELLRVNGLTLQSPQDQVSALLGKAGYTPEEIDYVLKNPLPQRSSADSIPNGVNVTASVQNMPQGGVAGIPSSPVSATQKKSGTLGLVMGIGILIVIGILGVGAYFLYTTGKGLSSFIPIPSPGTLYNQ